MLSLKTIFGKKVMTEEEEALVEQYVISPEEKEAAQKAAEEEIANLSSITDEEFIEPEVKLEALSLETNTVTEPMRQATPEEIEAANSDIDISYLLNDPRVVGWLSVQEQELLFSGLLLFYNPSAHTILDVGCGRADLYGYIKDLFQLDIYDSYTGMDMNPNMLDIAHKKYSGLNLISSDILNDDVDDKFDWVVGSGLFNLNDHPDMEDYSKRVIDKMLTKANIGIAVNMLIGVPEDLSEEDKAQLVVHDPAKWLDYLINKYNRVVCRHDYMPGDVTFIIFK